MKPLLLLPITLMAMFAGACAEDAAPEPQSAGEPAASFPTAAPLAESTAEAEPTRESNDPGPSGESQDGSDGEAPDPNSKLALTEIYTSDVHGYSIDLPQGWLVDDSSPLVIIRSEDDSSSPGRDGVPASMTKIDIVPLEGFPLDLEARVQQIREELSEITEEERITLIGGERAVWLRGSGGMTEDTGIVVVIVGNELYQIQAYGNPEPLKAIAFTFRSTE